MPASLPDRARADLLARLHDMYITTIQVTQMCVREREREREKESERKRERESERARADLLARLHDMYITTIQVLLSF